MKLTKVLVVLSILLTSTFTFANCTPYCRNPWLIRVRAVDISPDACSDALANVGGNIDDINTVIVPEVDLTFFFYQNFAAEFSLATSRHGVNISGSGTISDLGKVSLLMPSLTLLYHFCPDGWVDPYFGAGINYTFYYDVDKGFSDSVCYSDSAGFVAQVGIDFIFCRHFVLNVDVKKTYVDSTVKVSAGSSFDKTCLRVNPWTFGIGIGWRF